MAEGGATWLVGGVTTDGESGGQYERKTDRSDRLQMDERRGHRRQEWRGNERSLCSTPLVFLFS